MSEELFPGLQFNVGQVTAEQAKLFYKLAQIASDIPKVTKEGKNEHFGYSYARDAEVMDAVRTAMVTHRVAAVPTVAWQERVGEFTKVALDLTFVDGEGGGSITVRFYGEGQDKGDKGLYKAYTGALKYGFLKVFQIATDDDPEKDDSSQSKPRQQNRPQSGQSRPQKPDTEPEFATKEQRRHLQQLAESKGISPEAMIEQMKQRYGVEKSEQLKFKHAIELIAELEAMSR